MPDAQQRRGPTLKLYLVDGSASGVITAELGISSVRAVVASRTALPDLLRREEALRTGIYLLVGPDPDLPERQLAYVGEGDQVRTRLAAYDADDAKDFFTRVVLIVSKDENLTKAHGRYLESRINCCDPACGPGKAYERHRAQFQRIARAGNRGHGTGTRRDRGLAAGSRIRCTPAGRAGDGRGEKCAAIASWQ